MTSAPIDDLLVLVVGSIGVGKSSFLEKLAECFRESRHFPPAEFYPEPISKWMAFGDGQVKDNCLELMYRDPRRYGFEFQIMAAATKSEQLKNINRLSIVERSFQCQKHVFVPKLFHSGFLDSRQATILNMVLDDYIANPKFKPDIVIRLKCSPCVAISRIALRNRDGESHISLQYLMELERNYDTMLELMEDECELITIETETPLSFEDVDEIRIQLQRRYIEKRLRTLGLE